MSKVLSLSGKRWHIAEGETPFEYMGRLASAAAMMSYADITLNNPTASQVSERKFYETLLRYLPTVLTDADLGPLAELQVPEEDVAELLALASSFGRAGAIYVSNVYTIYVADVIVIPGKALMMPPVTPIRAPAEAVLAAVKALHPYPGKSPHLEEAYYGLIVSMGVRQHEHTPSYGAEVAEADDE